MRESCNYKMGLTSIVVSKSPSHRMLFSAGSLAIPSRYMINLSLSHDSSTHVNVSKSPSILFSVRACAQ